MRLHFDFSEYESEEDCRSVVLTVNLPDGQGHNIVTGIYEKAVSMLYGYNIGSSHDNVVEFSFGDETDGCEHCVQATCGAGCNKRQMEMEF
jgi:hypothetical protein